MKTILVTGVTRGIGRAVIELLLADKDTQVIGTYVSSDAEAELLKKKYLNLTLYKCDFASREQLTELIGKLTQYTFSGIVNNAGIILFEEWDKFTLEAWDKVQAVNVTAPLMISHGLRNNIEENGSIINVASTDGLNGAIASIAYSASKAALINVWLTFSPIKRYE